MRLRALSLAAIAVIVFTLLGISAVASPSAHPSRATLRLAAKSGISFRFNKTRLNAKAGSVQLVMSNPRGARVRHGIAVQGQGVDKDGRAVSPGHNSTVTVTLRPGRYTFYCPVPGHRRLGMHGVLVVHR